MSEAGQQIIFKQLLDRHGRVRVPMIQRDYAQGRESAAEVREEFLDALHGALKLPADDPTLPLNLDFIYGSVEHKGATCFLPLDGQQRLTTLFLLHWYLAWQDGCWEEFLELLCPNDNSRFSYAVRPSSTEFYNELVKFRPKGSPDSFESMSRLVTNQSWYFRYWRLDPTIQSSLRMLDAIHQRFRYSRDLYKRITDPERPSITFQLLDLENFGLSDDLYIKMNARGKPLTAFETFKARYEQELEIQFKGETRAFGDESFSVAEFFSRRMDTTWADFFWTHRNTETNLYDEAVMNLFRVVALLSRDPESKSYVEDVSSLRNKYVKSSFSIFHDKGWLDRNFSELFILLLEVWSKEGTDFTAQLPSTRFFNEALLFKKTMDEPTDLLFTEIVQFVGYVAYLRQHSDCLDSDAFQEWMRVVFNLSINTTYNREYDLQRSVSALLRMVPDSGNILRFLVHTERPITGFSEQQVLEEKLKAKLILAHAGWRSLINRAEAHGYFKGQIEFLLDFCGALGKCKDTDVAEWEDCDHSSLQKIFEDYLCKAEAMFRSYGLIDLGQYRWERALLSIGNYFLPSGRGGNVSFLTNSSTEQASWKRLLRGGDAKKARGLLQQLLDRIVSNDPLRTQLDQIIAEAEQAEELESWRQEFIRTPKAFEYCEGRAIRRVGNIVYLLKKTQMNGAHAELFTYCLFHNDLLPIASDVGFHPLELSKQYCSVNVTDIEPGIQFTWSRGNHSLTFDVEWNGHLFIIFIDSNSLEELPDVNDALRDMAGFTEEETNLLRETSSTDFLDVLLELRQALSATSNRSNSCGNTPDPNV